jgi:glyoxylase I family protein
MAIDVRSMTPLISVFDMPTSIAFYRDILGFVVAATSGPEPNCGWALIKLNGVELMLNTAYDDDQRPPAPDPRVIAAHNDTCLYFGCPDVDAAHEHLRAHGFKIDPPKVSFYGMKQVYVSDPDGYNLCLQWRPAQQT